MQSPPKKLSGASYIVPDRFHALPSAHEKSPDCLTANEEWPGDLSKLKERTYSLWQNNAFIIRTGNIDTGSIIINNAYTRREAVLPCPFFLPIVVNPNKRHSKNAWRIPRGESSGDNRLFELVCPSTKLKTWENLQPSILSHARAASSRSAKLMKAKPLARCVSRSRARNTLVTRPKRSNRSRNSCSSANSLTCTVSISSSVVVTRGKHVRL